MDKLSIIVDTNLDSTELTCTDVWNTMSLFNPGIVSLVSPGRISKNARNKISFVFEVCEFTDDAIVLTVMLNNLKKKLQDEKITLKGMTENCNGRVAIFNLM